MSVELKVGDKVCFDEPFVVHGDGFDGGVFVRIEKSIIHVPRTAIKPAPLDVEDIVVGNKSGVVARIVTKKTFLRLQFSDQSQADVMPNDFSLASAEQKADFVNRINKKALDAVNAEIARNEEQIRRLNEENEKLIAKAKALSN